MYFPKQGKSIFQRFVPIITSSFHKKNQKPSKKKNPRSKQVCTSQLKQNLFKNLLKPKMLWDERCLFVIFSDSTNCLKKKKEKRGEEKTERMLFRDRTPFKWSSSLSPSYYSTKVIIGKRTQKKKK
jgi:hypothetical protein